jgi:lipoprotein-releasing system permease protein
MSFFRKMPFEWLVGVRYTRAGKRSGSNSFISFISLLSMIVIALGVAALIIVLSVMNGFQKEVRDRMLSVVSHVEVIDRFGALPDWQATAREAMAVPEIKAAAPYVMGQSMITRNDIVRGIAVRGILPEAENKVSDIGGQMREGSFNDLKPGAFNVVLGRELARALKAGLQDKVNLIVPRGEVTASGALPQLRQFTVVGIFDAGHFEYDSTLAFVHIDDAMALYKLAAPSGLRFRIADLERAPQVAQTLSRTLTGDLLIRDWTRQNRTWFAAVQSQKTMMFLILTMIIAVAAFNMVSMLVMTVTDKQADIAILRTQGASPRSVMKIFVIQGALIGILGTAAGVIAGTLFALNVDVIVPVIEQALGVHFLSKDVYLISAVPSDLRWRDVATVGGVAFVLALMATLYPSWWAARVKPAEALRYE